MSPARGAPPTTATAPAHRGPFAALCVLLLWAPWPAGSNRSWAIAALFLGMATLLAVTWWQMLRRGRSPLGRLQRARVPLLALLAFAGLAAWQRQCGSAEADCATADRFQTLNYLLASATHVALFALVVLTVREWRRARALALLLVGAGVLQALFAVGLANWHLAHHVATPDAWVAPQATGSFVNRNHLAGYLSLCLSVGIGLLLGAMGSAATRTGLAGALAFVLGPTMVLRVSMLVMIVALVLTRSRMGNAAFLAAMVTAAFAAAATLPGARRRTLALLVSLLVVDLAVVGHWVGLERVLVRIDRTALAEADRRGEETLAARLRPARDSLAMIAERPWTGHGGGTYYTAFPPYRSEATAPGAFHVDHAHNDPVEIAADTGLTGLGLLALVVGSTLARVRRLLGPGMAPIARGIALGALMATTGILLHGLVDFNLQIPANALGFTAVLALVWALPLRRGGA